MSKPAATPIRLTQYSHGAGCGCKLAPLALESILSQAKARAGGQADEARLLVGNSSRDDAAVYDLGGARALISTTDFFMPIVDDPATFGRIAATNAMSDVWAMGGRPVLAIAILGWPIDRLSAAIAAEVVAGAQAACAEAGVALAGGHSIESPEPIFGLAVTGLVAHDHIKRNDTGRPGDLLFLTKPLGVGILTTAEKRGSLRIGDEGRAAAVMARLNAVGEPLGGLAGVSAMTDVTGFGLLGHLAGMLGPDALAAELDLAAIPTLTDLAPYLRAGTIPGGTRRNLDAWSHLLGPMTDDARQLLADPQTSGGLLIAGRPDAADAIRQILASAGLGAFAEPIGRLMPARPELPRVVPRH